MKLYWIGDSRVKLVLGFALTCCLVLIHISFSLGVPDSVFDLSETRVSSSPAEPRRLMFPTPEKPLDFDVSPAGPEVSVLVKNASGAHKVVLWDMALPEGRTVWEVPQDVQPRYIAWHPTARRFFLTGAQSAQFVILSVSEAAGGWEAKTIYRSSHEIRRLVTAPRPFITDDEIKKYPPLGQVLDATLLSGRDGVLCALHRRDSFVVLQPDAAGTRVAAYRWNGFGFSGIDDSDVIARCRSLFDTTAAQH